MGNEEFERKQDLDQEKQLELSESSSSEHSHSVNHSKEIQDLQNQLHQLQDQLASYQTETHEKEKRIAEEFAGMKALLLEKAQALETANTELAEKKQVISAIKTEFVAQNEKVSNLEEELKLVKTESREKILEKTEQAISLEVELKETKNLLTTAEEKSQEYEIEKEAYLTQIEKLQDVIQQTEEEIKEIEASHLEVQDQLRHEINRTDERAGQMREDLKRETRGTLARDRHIRVVLQQTELGRILLYLVDYFENTKKKTLALGTLSTEVGIPPIICRTHLRHLHELAVCEFNEVSREIRLIRKAR